MIAKLLQFCPMPMVFQGDIWNQVLMGWTSPTSLAPPSRDFDCGYVLAISQAGQAVLRSGIYSKRPLGRIQATPQAAPTYFLKAWAMYYEWFYGYLWLVMLINYMCLWNSPWPNLIVSLWLINGWLVACFVFCVWLILINPPNPTFKYKTNNCWLVVWKGCSTWPSKGFNMV